MSCIELRRDALALAALASTLCLGLALTGCEQIAGIERRSFRDRDGGLPDGGRIELKYPDEDACEQFCTLAESGCTPETSGVFAYRKDTNYCRSLCRHMPLAADPAKFKNTDSFECRQQQAEDAFEVRGDPREGKSNCQSASAGGGPNCGDNCESYCRLFANICAETSATPRENCLEECAELASDDAIDADQAFSSANADTVQCRLSHLGAAATADTETHCKHASIYIDELTPCMGPMPRCQDYCALTMNVCDNKGERDLRQYETLQDCLNVCSMGLVNNLPLEAGKTQDKEGDTVACRRYHAYNALLFDRPYHCNHAGPGGDGHCGPICPVYCKLVKTVCAEDFKGEFNDNLQECEEACAQIPAIAARPDNTKKLDYTYNVGTGLKGGNTIQCRLYHASKALGNRGACESALGGGKCVD